MEKHTNKISTFQMDSLFFMGNHEKTTAKNIFFGKKKQYTENPPAKIKKSSKLPSSPS